MFLPALILVFHKGAIVKSVPKLKTERNGVLASAITKRTLYPTLSKEPWLDIKMSITPDTPFQKGDFTEA